MHLEASENNNVVVGLGITGISCARYLADKGEPFTIVDSRTNPPALLDFKKEFPQTGITLGEISDQSLKGASLIVVSPGVAMTEPAIARAVSSGVPTCGDIDLFRREAEAPIVAITGSNGKSTVTTLVGLMAEKAGKKVAVGGNLGLPALDLLRIKNPDLYVLELSSFQLERAGSLHVDVATVLNVTADHMDRYDSFSAYCKAKQRIFTGCKQVVVNRADSLSTPPDEILQLENGKIWSYGLDEPFKNGFGLTSGEGKDCEQQYLTFESQRLLPVSELKIVGRHNVENALAALALGHAMGIEMPAMLQALREFPGLDHRCQFVRVLDNIEYFNDSKGTNVGAVIASVLGLADDVNKVILIAGGDSKGADFSPLLPVLKKYARAVVLIGAAAKDIENILGSGVEIYCADTMNNAVAIAQSKARPGDRVLLSPACASFDMFDNYQHRGIVFSEAVMNLCSLGGDL